MKRLNRSLLVGCLVDGGQALRSEGTDGFEPLQGILGVLDGLMPGQRRLVFEIDKTAVDAEHGNFATPAEDAQGPADQGGQQFRLQPAVGGAQHPHHVG